MTKSVNNSLIAALSLLFALAFSPLVNAAENPFGMSNTAVDQMQVADSHQKEGKCGEGKCGGEKKSKCGDGKDKKSGKCGEGKCGGEKKGKCGDGDDDDDKAEKKGKCGAE